MDRVDDGAPGRVKGVPHLAEGGRRRGLDGVAFVVAPIGFQRVDAPSSEGVGIHRLVAPAAIHCEGSTGQGGGRGGHEGASEQDASAHSWWGQPAGADITH